MKITKEDRQTIINSLSMTINHLDDATESFVIDCYNLRLRLEGLDIPKGTK